jgi:hypothetical protein
MDGISSQLFTPLASSGACEPPYVTTPYVVVFCTWVRSAFRTRFVRSSEHFVKSWMGERRYIKDVRSAKVVTARMIYMGKLIFECSAGRSDACVGKERCEATRHILSPWLSQSQANTLSTFPVVWQRCSWHSRRSPPANSASSSAISRYPIRSPTRSGVTLCPDDCFSSEGHTLRLVVCNICCTPDQHFYLQLAPTQACELVRVRICTTWPGRWPRTMVARCVGRDVTCMADLH